MTPVPGAPFRRRPIRIAAALLVATIATVPTARAQDADLLERVERLTRELQDLKAELARRAVQPAAPGAPAPAAAPGAAAASPPAASPPSTAFINGPAAIDAEPTGPATVLSSYGELNYNRPRGDAANTQADVRRFVIGLQHRFDARTKMVGEVEFEHAVTSADDPGEAEIEQAYVEHQFAPRLAARAGLFLIPLGLLNENHEPTAYYGVERNFVETAIIPTTWREGGVQLVGELDAGWTLQGGVSTGFDLNKWDATSGEGRESPLGAVHQELALARARDLSLFAAANWRGIPGLRLGGGAFTGGASQGVPGTVRSRVTLVELHARWTPGPWDLSVQAARGTISNTAAFNAPLVGNPTLVPARFDGAYLQAAYRMRIAGANGAGGYGLAPFARIESFNTGRRYADLGAGLTPDPLPTTRVITTGVNFELTREVVLKADIQWFHPDTTANRLNLGLGWSF